MRTYQDLPDPVLDFMGGFRAIASVREIVRKHVPAFSTDRLSDISSLVESIVLGVTAVSDVPAKLVEALGTDEDTGKRVAVDLLIERVLPVADLVGLEVEPALLAWGADPARVAAVERVRAEEPVAVAPAEPARSEVREALGAAAEAVSDPVVARRLEMIAESFRAGVRTREEAVETLMRPQKTGGLGMSERAANDALDLVGKAEGGVPGSQGLRVAETSVPTPTSLSEPANPTPSEPSASLSEPATLRTSEPSSRPDAFTDADAAEVARVAREKQAAMETPALITDTRAAAENIAREVGLTFESGELKTRFEHIIDARLRDVRDGFDTRAKLEAPVEQGGIGLSGARLVAVVEAAERMDAMHHKALAEEMARKKEAVKAEKAGKALDEDGVRAREAQVMAKRYAEVTGQAPRELIEPVPSRATSAPPTEDVARRERQIDADKVRAAIEAAKPSGPAVTAAFSAASVPPVTSGRPRVEDIRFERKLAGPVEELRLMNLRDFRRLSKDPSQAAHKVRDKVDLVSLDGYDQRIAAIRAWRASPLVQTYVALSREALLSGVSISQVLSAKRAAGEDVPSDEELRVIVELNGSLRF